MSSRTIQSNSKKRSNHETIAPPKKRGRYTAAACNECKKRKTKCSGSIPCRSCNNLEIECVYSSESAETLSQKNTATIIQDLQRQVHDLWEAVYSLESQAEHDESSRHYDQNHQTPNNNPIQLSSNIDSPNSRLLRRSTGQRRNSFLASGPTSSEYSLQKAEPALRDMGVPVPHEIDDRQVRSNVDSTTTEQIRLRETQSLHEKLLDIGQARIMELLEAYREDIGLQYPFLNIASVIAYVKLSLFGKHKLPNTPTHEDEGNPCNDGKENVIAAMLAVSLAAQREDKDIDLADGLILSLNQFEQSLGVQNEDIDRQRLIILILKGMYYFFRNDERLAWRTIGIVARMSEEIGLNRQVIVLQNYSDKKEREWMMKLFWSVYVLDRRWSFGTGLSFALQDENIDLSSDLPDDDASRYLKSMISYCQIASRVWRDNSTSHQNTTNNVSDDQGFLEYLTTEWLNSIPSDLQISNPEDGFDPVTNDRGVFRLCLLLYLRANQMRILIYRNTFFKQKTTLAHNEHIRKTVDTARETIRILVGINRTSDIYKTQQICFNHFLDSALTVLVLSICHAPNQYPQICREEFHSALELIQTLSMPSPISKRLWKVVRKLKQVAFPEISLEDDQIQNRNQQDGVTTFPKSGLEESMSNSYHMHHMQNSMESRTTYDHQDVNNLFWELFEAGNCSFPVKSDSQILQSESPEQMSNEIEISPMSMPSTNEMPQKSTIGEINTLSDNHQGNLNVIATNSTSATDITGQRLIRRTDLDFFDLASHVRSPNFMELSNDMFFF